VTWTFPILVDRFKGNQALRMGCNGCGRTTLYESVDAFMEAVEGRCPRCGSSDYPVAFEEGARCGNCRRLSLDHPVRVAAVFYCSRSCELQGEYARALKERAS
jgi:ribosomal protein L37E